MMFSNSTFKAYLVILMASFVLGCDISDSFVETKKDESGKVIIFDTQKHWERWIFVMRMDLRERCLACLLQAWKAGINMGFGH